MLTTVRYVTNELGNLVAVPDTEAVVKVAVWGMEARHKILLSKFLEEAKVGQCDAYIDGGAPGQVGVVQVVATFSSQGGGACCDRVVERIKAWVADYEQHMRRRIICTFADATDGMRVRGMNLVHQGITVEVVRGEQNVIKVSGDWEDGRAVMQAISGRIKK